MANARGSTTYRQHTTAITIMRKEIFPYIALHAWCTATEYNGGPQRVLVGLCQVRQAIRTCATTASVGGRERFLAI